MWQQRGLGWQSSRFSVATRDRRVGVVARRNRHGMAQVGVLVVQLDQCRVFGKFTAMGPHVSSDDTEGRQLRVGACTRYRQLRGLSQAKPPFEMGPFIIHEST